MPRALAPVHYKAWATALNRVIGGLPDKLIVLVQTLPRDSLPPIS